MFKKLTIICAVLALLGGTVWAATYSDFVSGDLTLSRSAYEPVGQVPYFQARQIDLSHSNINSGSGVTTGDVVRLVNIPAGTHITDIYFAVRTKTVNTGVSVTMGDGDDADGYVTSVASSSVSGYRIDPQAYVSASGLSVWCVSGVSSVPSGHLINTAGRYLQDGGKYYSTADTIDMTVTCDKGLSAVTGIYVIAVKGFKIPTN